VIAVAAAFDQARLLERPQPGGERLPVRAGVVSDVVEAMDAEAFPAQGG